MSYLPCQDEVLFRKTLRYSLTFYFVLSLAIALIQLPVPKPTDIRDLPDRVAKLILEPPKAAPSPPAPKEIKQKPVAKPEGKSKSKPAGTPKKKISKRKTIKKKAPRPSSTDRNREIVRKSGLLASLVGEEVAGSLGIILEDKRMDKALSQPNVISSPARKKNRRPTVSKSGSIKTQLADNQIKKIGSLKKGDRVQLAKREKVTVTHLKGAGGDGGSGVSGHGLGSGVGVRLRGSGSGNASIDYDAIARVVEKYKGGLIFLYNKELRSNPILKGTVTVEFSIDEKGKVVDAHVVNSSMDHARLEKALARRIKRWKFPKLFDGIIVVTYPFVFFPV